MINRKIKMLFLMMQDLLYSKHKNNISVYSTEETLIKLISDNKSISRFGDGEFNLIMGLPIKSQRFSIEIAEKLSRILSTALVPDNLIIAIPYSYVCYTEFTMKSKLFWCKYWAEFRGTVYPFLNSDYKYYDSQVTRIYINRKDKSRSIEYFNNWKKLWENKDVLIVEGVLTRFGVGNGLFQNARKVNRILCPSSNAYEKYQDIFQYVHKKSNYFDLILLILGPTASIMAYDLARKGIHAVDIGNLDMEYEWLRNKVKKAVAVKGKYTIEASGGTIVEKMDDESYKEQIIMRIGC